MSRRRFLRASAAAAAASVLPACGGGGGGGSGSGNPLPSGGDTLLGVLQQNDDLSLFLRAVQEAGLGDRYNAAGANLTLFAADNAAMNLLGSRLGFGDGAGLVRELSDSQWADIVSFSTIPQALSRATLDGYARNGTRPTTQYAFEGTPRPLIFVFSGGVYTIWDDIGRVTIQMTRNDLGASNGVLHVVDAPLLPRGVLTVSQMLRASVDAFGSFAAQMVARGVSGELDGSGPYTVFAPGFVDVGTLTSAGVRNHVIGSRLDSTAFGSRSTLTTLAGRQLALSGSTITSGTTQGRIIDVDFWGRNGVIHTVDRVIPL